MAQSEGRRGFSPIKKRARRTWFKYFLRRNPEVKAKMSQNLSIFRAMGANKVQINKFFDELRDWIRMWKLEYSPNSVWNVDECGLGDVPKSQKVVGVTGERPFQTVADEKAQNTTLLNYISTGGVAMKPMIIFKNAAIKKEWREAAPSGYFLRASSSGYINSKIFFEYGKEFVKFLEKSQYSTRKKQGPSLNGSPQITPLQLQVYEDDEGQQCWSVWVSCPLYTFGTTLGWYTFRSVQERVAEGTHEPESLSVWPLHDQATILQVFHTCISGWTDTRSNKKWIQKLWYLSIWQKCSKIEEYWSQYSIW